MKADFSELYVVVFVKLISFYVSVKYLVFQGDSADCMYFVEDGEVRITIRNMVSHKLVLVLLTTSVMLDVVK